MSAAGCGDIGWWHHDRAGAGVGDMNGQHIQAIETTFNGTRFRSRLEARWATFFTVLKIPYEYEPEGFELGDGVRYLPDFWLPDQKIWFEVKGPEPNAQEIDKACRLAEQSCRIVVIQHPIALHDISVLLDSDAKNQVVHIAHPELGEVFSRWTFGACLACHKVSFARMGGACDCTHGMFYGMFSPAIIDAYCWANGLRFDRPGIQKLTSGPIKPGRLGYIYGAFHELMSLIGEGLVAKINRQALEDISEIENSNAETGE